MNVLVVDDQLSVVKGILFGVRFDQLGIDTVKSATNAKEARNIISQIPINIILCDIEMPGENGLELNKWIAENYPDIIRILLTSHANFLYAQESLKLGCFDYIVQPAPYDEIENSLKRAIAKIQADQQKEQVYNYGKIYLSFEPEMVDRTIFNLYSRHPENVRQSLSLLNKIGYPIKDESEIQIIIIDIYPYYESIESELNDNSIRNKLIDALKIVKIDLPVYSLITLNKMKQFVILLFCNEASLLPLSSMQDTTFYHELTASLSKNIACYFSDNKKFVNLRAELEKIHNYINNNVSKKPGFYKVNNDSISQDYLDLSENINRWERLLKAGQINSLRSDIMSYIDFIVSIDKANFRSICNLHQQLTHIFFNYSYDNNIDIIKLFTKDYQYNDYMDGFKDVDSLRKSVAFITNAIDSRVQNEQSQNDVKKAKTYILNNISQNISVKDVAEYIHLSPEYFTKLFKKETGLNIKNYIMQVKVNVAKDLLGNPNIPVSLVALELGFSNFSHFTQMFKNFENVTPSEYRKKVLHKEE